MNKPYTVALQEARDLPDRERIEAEVCFGRELERVLGGGEYVAETYAAWLTVNEYEANQIDRETAISAARWPVAMNAAIQAGFSRLGDIGDAHFEVRLERGHVAAD
jgi:hypothetical protein